MKNNELPNLIFSDEKLFTIEQENCLACTKKDEWPPSSPDLNPLDFSIWSILEANVNKTPHKSHVSCKRKF